MQKNIAIIIPSLSGGGAERVASLLSRYFVNKNNNVFFFLEKYDKRTAYPHSGEIDYYPDYKIEGSIIKQANIILEQAKYIRKLKNKYNIDIAISFMEEANYINILSKRKEQVIIRVCTILSEREKEFNKKLVYQKKILPLVYNNADNIVVMTKYAKRDLIQQWHIKEKIIKIIENPLDFNYIKDSLKEAVDWKYGDKVIISVNRLDVIKSQWHIIKAFSIVHKHIPDAKLLFIGDGVCKNRLLILTKKYKLEDCIIFAGHKSNVYPFIKNSKGFVLSSKTEGFPNSMLEALYVGTPVISADCPGAPKEILANKYLAIKTDKVRYLKYGILVPDFIECEDNTISKEELKLANAIMDLLNNSKIYNYYKNCAKKHIESYSLDNIGTKWDEIIH